MNISPIIAYQIRNNNSKNNSVSDSNNTPNNANFIYKISAMAFIIIAVLCAIGALVCAIPHVAHIATTVLGAAAAGCFMLAVMFFIFYCDE